MKKINQDEIFEYIIYCRKSSDESSDKQTQSIPTQIQHCLEYAEREGLKIKSKPKDFLIFEDKKEILKEDTDKDLINRKIYKDTRKYYIIKEQFSAKTPFKRKKWNKLIKLIEKGKIKGIISYSPDRQARNSVDGGMIIDFADRGMLDLKYTNFHFDHSASGKMMLGIWFVFSKQYSDKLSEDITAGSYTKHAKGMHNGVTKHGYTCDDETLFHKPHETNFKLIKKAFHMKIHEKKVINI